MDQFLTYKTANLGPVFNFTAYIYIHDNNPRHISEEEPGQELQKNKKSRVCKP